MYSSRNGRSDFTKNSKLGNNKHTVISRVSFMFILNEEFNLKGEFQAKYKLGPNERA